MHFAKMMYLFVILVLVFTAFFVELNADSNYGPFILRFENITTCKGPKTSDCGTHTFYLYNDVNNTRRLNVTVDFHKDCLLSQIRAQTNTVQSSGGTKKLFNYNIQKPCQHFFFGDLLRNTYNANERCLVKKGLINMDISIDQLTRMFFGSKFFYGSYVIKTTAFNKLDNFACSKSVMIFLKNE